MTLTLLFDLDDTLLDSNIDALIPVYFQKLAAYLSDTVPPEKLLRELMVGTVQMYGNQTLDRTLEQAFSDHFYPALGFPESALAKPIDEFYDNVFPSLQPLTAPRPEAVELVEWAFARGWKPAIATDPLFPRKAILHRLRWAGLAPEDYPFALIPDFETFHYAKASVAYFPEFLARMGWSDGPLLMIGDSVERDILPAIKAGIPAFWLKSNGQSAPEIGNTPQGTLADLRRYLETVDLSQLKPDFSSPSAMIASLQATPSVLHSLSLGLDDSVWALRPASKEWSFTEILCHMRDVDSEVNLQRIETVLREDNPFLPGQVTDPWAEERNYIQQDGAQAFKDFVAARARLVARLQALTPQEWERPARHAIFGPTHLRELVGFIAEHDRSHLQQAMRFAQ